MWMRGCANAQPEPMANELTAEDIDWGLSEDAPPGGGVKDELLSLALTEMHKQQLINGRDRERLIRLREEQRRSQEPSSTESDQPTPNLFKTAQEIADMTPENVAWVVRGFAAEHSLTELTGLPKEAGKTSFLMGMVHSVLTSDSFLDQPTSQGPVVYLTEEKTPTFKAALQRADLLTQDIAGDLHVMTYWNAAQLGWEGICKQAKRQCDETNAKLLVIDTLSQFAGFTGEQENASGDANESLVRLQQIAHDHAVAVIVVRHDRKSGGRVGQAGRGSGAFTAGVDIALHLGRPEGQGKPTLRVLTSLSRYEETPATLMLDRIDSFHSREGVGKERTTYQFKSLGEPRAIAREQSEAELFKVLPTNEAEAMTVAKILEATGVGKATLHRTLKDLLDREQINRKKEGKAYRYFRAVVNEMDSFYTST